jgi:hypothetical protein
MLRFRFSLLGLAAVVTLIAIGCAALACASSVISGLVWSVTVLILAFATLAAAVRSSPHRFWWLGFVMFGWLHVLTMLGPLSGLAEWMQINKVLEKTAMMMPKATTTVTISALDGVGYGMNLGDAAFPVSGSAEGGMYGGAMPGGMGMGGAAMVPTSTFQTQNNEYIAAFVRTSQALLTLLLACLGGFAGNWMHERNRTPARI